MNEERVNLTIRNSPAVWSIFSRLSHYMPLMSKNELVRDAIEHALDTKPDWKQLALLKQTEQTDCSIKGGPEFIQLRVNGADWLAVLEDIKKSFTPHLKSVKSVYGVKLITLNYLNYLTRVNSGERDTAEEKITAKAEELGAPEMSALLTSMILENSPLLEPIKKIMNEYKKGAKRDKREKP